MKKMYWHPHNLPRIIMVIFCIFVLAGLATVELYKKDQPQPFFKEKFAASSLASNAFMVIQNLRTHKKIPFSNTLDPQGSGLIGEQLTSISTDSGDLRVKQTTINSNIAALFISWFKKLKLKEGDTVAVGMTGSFPALDISMLSAIHALNLNPLLIFSGGASQYGANIPRLSWIDMYGELKSQQIFPYPVLGASIGGKQDRGFHMDPKGIKTIKAAIKKNHIHFIKSKNTLDAIAQRMALYKQASQNNPIRAYINVGGGMASIGMKKAKDTNSSHEIKPHTLETGVINKLPISLMTRDSVAIRFLKKGIPVVNVHNVGKILTQQYGFPPAPKYAPFIGESSLFRHKEYRTWLAGLFLGLDILVFIIITLISRKYMIRYKA